MRIHYRDCARAGGDYGAVRLENRQSLGQLSHHLSKVSLRIVPSLPHYHQSRYNNIIISQHYISLRFSKRLQLYLNIAGEQHLLPFTMNRNEMDATNRCRGAALVSMPSMGSVGDIERDIYTIVGLSASAGIIEYLDLGLTETLSWCSIV